VDGRSGAGGKHHGAADEGGAAADAERHCHPP
jgi:hypothetical protein